MINNVTPSHVQSWQLHLMKYDGHVEHKAMGDGRMYICTLRLCLQVVFLLLIHTLIVTDTASVYTTTAETQPKTQ